MREVNGHVKGGSNGYQRTPNKELDILYPLAIIIVMTPQDLKAWRKANNHTQQGLANALGVLQITIARWETGVRKIPSFLHLALRCLELEGGEQLTGERKRQRKGGSKHGNDL